MSCLLHYYVASNGVSFFSIFVPGLIQFYSLTCSHSFCATCLESHFKKAQNSVRCVYKCPLCEKHTGMPHEDTNFKCLVEKVALVLHRSSPPQSSYDQTLFHQFFS